MRARRSLKATLMLWVVVLLVLIVPVRSWLDLRGQTARNELAFDHALNDWALAIGNLLRGSGQPADPYRLDLNAQTERTLRTRSEEAIYYVVLGPTGEVIAGDIPLAGREILLQRGDRRLLPTVLGDEPLRMAVHAVECGAGLCQVRVAETMRHRDAMRRQAVAGTVSFAVLASLVFGLAIWLGVWRAFRPIAAINSQLAQRSFDDLRPLQSVTTVPAEVQPLLQAIDQLLQRVSSDAQRQRDFIADAAHQLRTPLTALQTETEVALLEPHPPAVRATMQRLHRQARRAARLADQLLALARTDASVRESATEPIDLRDLAREAAQDWVPRAIQAGGDLGFQLDAAMVRGRRVLLREMLANLIHNALEYAGPNPQVTVRTGRVGPGPGGQPMLEVEDCGPGIPREERERVLERFARGSDAPGTGSGLGLAIVRDIALAHGAQLELLDAETETGLRVRVVFPISGLDWTAGLAPGREAVATRAVLGAP